jgi:membrane-associated phospholipid phosphatase
MAKQRLLSKIEKKQVAFTASTVTAFVLFAMFTMAFVKVAWEVREQETQGFDDAVLNGIHGMSNGFLDSFIPVATDIGGVIGVSLLTLAVLALFVYKREYRRALVVFVGVAGSAIINLVLKSVFERARPDLWQQLIHESSYSFPSGHSMASAALGLAVVVALWNSRWRWWALSAGAAYILFVGFSRLYLGVHYPTDVIAGWLVSGAWIMAVALLFRSKLGHQALKRLP